jgi:hypothetical protein
MVTKKCRKMPKMPTFLVTENANKKTHENRILDHNCKNGKKW